MKKQVIDNLTFFNYDGNIIDTGVDIDYFMMQTLKADPDLYNFYLKYFDAIHEKDAHNIKYGFLNASADSHSLRMWKFQSNKDSHFVNTWIKKHQSEFDVIFLNLDNPYGFKINSNKSLIFVPVSNDWNSNPYVNSSKALEIYVPDVGYVNSYIVEYATEQLSKTQNVDRLNFILHSTDVINLENKLKKNI